MHVWGFTASTGRLCADVHFKQVYFLTNSLIPVSTANLIEHVTFIYSKLLTVFPIYSYHGFSKAVENVFEKKA